MTNNAVIRIYWDTSVQAYRMTSPFNRQLVDALKTHIPVSDRSYDPTTKVWTFVEKALTPLQGVLKLLGLQTVVITRQQAEVHAAASQSAGVASGAAPNGAPTSSSRESLDTVIIRFVRTLPYDAARSAYRKAAMTLHPDQNGGDGTRAATLNAAWTRIEKEVYGQQ